MVVGKPTRPSRLRVEEAESPRLGWNTEKWTPQSVSIVGIVSAWSPTLCAVGLLLCFIPIASRGGGFSRNCAAVRLRKDERA